MAPKCEQCGSDNKVRPVPVLGDGGVTILLCGGCRVVRPAEVGGRAAAEQMRRESR